jgi:anti-sigma factor RsiW
MDNQERDWKALASGYLDGELDRDERREFEARLAQDPELVQELEALRAMREVTASMKLRGFPDEVWEHYWDATYNRLERRVGWLLFSLGAVLLTAGGLYELAVSLLRESADPWWVRLGIGAGILGLVMLFVSVLRERLFTWKRDPYREVMK